MKMKSRFNLFKAFVAVCCIAFAFTPALLGEPNITIFALSFVGTLILIDSIESLFTKVLNTLKKNT